jgi:hypothetical protein
MVVKAVALATLVALGVEVLMMMAALERSQ